MGSPIGGAAHGEGKSGWSQIYNCKVSDLKGVTYSRVYINAPGREKENMTVKRVAQIVDHAVESLKDPSTHTINFLLFESQLKTKGISYGFYKT